MNYRRLGKTGLMVSEIGLVGAAQSLHDGLKINMLFPVVMLVLMVVIWIKEKKKA